MIKLNYRDAEIIDLERIVEVYNSTIPSRMVTADTEPVTVQSRMKWFEDHTPSRRPLWVIEEEGGEMVGWVSFQSFYGRPAYDGTVEISIYLDANQRGRGLGKQVIAHCIEQIPKYGITTLLGFIFAHNIPSIKLFEYFGFEQWGMLPNIAVLDGEEKSLMILGKRLC
ncbi:MAG: GNAT family N-acetyltransferase [Flavobacterium sp.]